MEDLSFLTPESKQYLQEFIVRYINLLKKQKDIKNDIKSIKKEYNELGLPTRLALKAYKRMTSEKKSDSYEEASVDMFKDVLLSSKDVQDAFTELEEE